MAKQVPVDVCQKANREHFRRHLRVIPNNFNSPFEQHRRKALLSNLRAGATTWPKIVGALVLAASCVRNVSGIRMPTMANNNQSDGTMDAQILLNIFNAGNQRCADVPIRHEEGDELHQLQGQQEKRIFLEATNMNLGPNDESVQLFHGPCLQCEDSNACCCRCTPFNMPRNALLSPPLDQMLLQGWTSCIGNCDLCRAAGTVGHPCQENNCNGKHKVFRSAPKRVQNQWVIDQANGVLWAREVGKHVSIILPPSMKLPDPQDPENQTDVTPAEEQADRARMQQPQRSVGQEEHLNSGSTQIGCSFPACPLLNK